MSAAQKVQDKYNFIIKLVLTSNFKYLLSKLGRSVILTDDLQSH